MIFIFKTGLIMHVGSAGKWSKIQAMFYPARNDDYGEGDTPGLVLDCGGIISFTKAFAYLGPLLHRGLSDNRNADVSTKKAPQAFAALTVCIFGSANVP